MKYYLYCSAGNTVGLNEYLGFFEIAADGYCARYLEIQSGGDALRYTELAPSDKFGILPEGPWNEGEAAKPAYGTLTCIEAGLFETAWKAVECRND